MKNESKECQLIIFSLLRLKIKIGELTVLRTLGLQFLSSINIRSLLVNDFHTEIRRTIVYS